MTKEKFVIPVLDRNYATRLYIEVCICRYRVVLFLYVLLTGKRKEQPLAVAHRYVETEHRFAR